MRSTCRRVIAASVLTLSALGALGGTAAAASAAPAASGPAHSAVLFHM